MAVEAKLRTLGARGRRESRSFLGREFAPGEQVAVRAEITGPPALRRLRAGIDMRGDGGSEAWTGLLSRRPVTPEPGEDAFAALRRALGARSGAT